MSLSQLREELSSINEGLFYGEIEFTYDAMGFTMSFSHPSEIIGDMVGELDAMLEYDTADPEELNLMLSGMKEMIYSFDLMELKTPIATLENYLESIKGE